MPKLSIFFVIMPPCMLFYLLKDASCARGTYSNKRAKERQGDWRLEKAHRIQGIYEIIIRIFPGVPVIKLAAPCLIHGILQAQRKRLQLVLATAASSVPDHPDGWRLLVAVRRNVQVQKSAGERM